MTELRKIQLTELAMLKALKTVCEENAIPYFLAQGTLLGAVREGGFIEWDDDIDTLVPFREISRLVKLFSERYSDEYLITNHHVEKYYPSTWTKIRKIKSASMPERYKELPINWGICIDVFPFYPVSGVRVLRRAEILLFKCGRKLLMGSMTKYDSERSLSSRLVEKIPLRLRRAAATVLTGVFRLHGDGTKYVYLTCKGGRVMERSVLFGGDGKTEARLSFEGGEYRVPADYNRYLTEMFGDYMTPPPPSERGGHDLMMGNIIWDTDNSYLLYK